MFLHANSAPHKTPMPNWKHNEFFICNYLNACSIFWGISHLISMQARIEGFRGWWCISRLLFFLVVFCYFENKCAYDTMQLAWICCSVRYFMTWVEKKRSNSKNEQNAHTFTHLRTHWAEIKITQILYADGMAWCLYLHIFHFYRQQNWISCCDILLQSMKVHIHYAMHIIPV